MSLAGLGAFAEGFASARIKRKDRAERLADAERQDRLITALGARPDTELLSGGGGMGNMMGSAGADTLGAAPRTPVNGDGTLLGLIDQTEGGGSFSTLFGHSQNGGRFHGIDVSRMTLAQLGDFADPNGEYGQWVKGKVGRVATPMGRYQIVGTTLRNAATEMGLSGDTVFSPQTQTAIAEHLARKRLSSARSPAAKRIAMRAEWEGFKHVPDSHLDQAIAQFEAGGGSFGPRALGAIGGQPQ
ncbi:hypothetical protein SAMN05421774_10856 [Gemmobacter megaterium]|uniref:Uncharacterized protein n=1 Tax=Gemmobacter megaterium TaxID=1086013 RepID=A0A1N7QAX3_9RHOB|nr:hypothetical protein [Gemmobacter megaterium]GGE24342.1 hypothetical protein GCM10011345_32890 [Gemmobacter megaterium]SIT19954.1 hypothetical protein SAMN05421774_10856 [Gemmobacter megaterium]